MSTLVEDRNLLNAIHIDSRANGAGQEMVMALDRARVALLAQLFGDESTEFSELQRRTVLASIDGTLLNVNGAYRKILTDNCSQTVARHCSLVLFRNSNVWEAFKKTLHLNCTSTYGIKWLLKIGRKNGKVTNPCNTLDSPKVSRLQLDRYLKVLRTSLCPEASLLIAAMPCPVVGSMSSMLRR